MKCRVFFILFIVPCLLAYGCNTMRGIEDDMSSLLEHMESGRQLSESAEGRNASAGVSSSQSTGSVKQSKKENHSLTIRVFPEDSTVKVMNVRSRYYPGMRLVPGKYDILVEHEGHQSFREWVNVDDDMIVKVILKEQEQADMTTSVVPAEKSDSEGTAPVEEDAVIIPPGSAAPAFPSRLSGHYGSVSSLCFSPDGHILAASAKDGIRIWKID